MNIEYKGLNHRGRAVWIDVDYYDETKPWHFELEEWQIPRYRELVETAESCMGRKLTRPEAQTMEWLSRWEPETSQIISNFIKEAHLNQK
ncbi:hypothetical protein B2I21_35020 [Chryseobacterium mucoviscidosis]|nr:hypothetical protein B2I21_35020 [Chryseobacterium mucoviscidosis]